MSSSSTWILVADEAHARLFATERPDGALDEVASFVNLEEISPSGALVVGPAAAAHEGIGSKRRTMLRRKHTERFSRRLKDALERGRIDHRYARLVLIAPPRFLSALHVSLSQPLRDSVVAQVKRNLTALPARDIRSHLPRRLLGGGTGTVQARSPRARPTSQ